MNSRSTNSQMICYLDSVYAACDCDSYAVAVYFSVKKSFYFNSHPLLLSKHESFHFVRALLALINSYLLGRHQSVCINQSISSALPVTPQGSVLDPLLFLCFVFLVIAYKTANSDSLPMTLTSFIMSLHNLFKPT